MRIFKTKSLYFLLLIMIVLMSCSQNQEVWKIDSPDGNILLSIFTRNGEVNYSAEINGKSALAKSDLGLVRDNQDFSRNLTFISSSKRTIKEEYKTITGKRVEDVNHCNEITLNFENENGNPIEMVFRAYDDGIAFRYNFCKRMEKSIPLQMNNPPLI